MEENMTKRTLLICQAAIRIGRIWGIMETLGAEGFPPLDTLQSIDFLVEWSREYAAGEQRDLADYLEEKLRSSPDPPCIKT